MTTSSSRQWLTFIPSSSWRSDHVGFFPTPHHSCNSPSRDIVLLQVTAIYGILDKAPPACGYLRSHSVSPGFEENNLASGQNEGPVIQNNWGWGPAKSANDLLQSTEPELAADSGSSCSLKAGDTLPCRAVQQEGQLWQE